MTVEPAVESTSDAQTAVTVELAVEGGVEGAKTAVTVERAVESASDA